MLWVPPAPPLIPQRAQTVSVVGIIYNLQNRGIVVRCRAGVIPTRYTGGIFDLNQVSSIFIFCCVYA
jgi:hypothetical protein